MKKLETLFLLKDPATLARFDLLHHAADMMQQIDSKRLELRLEGIKLTVTAYCESNVEADSGHLWKKVRFAVRLLRSHRSKTHLDVSLVVNQTERVTIVTYGGTKAKTYDGQSHYNEAFPRIAEDIVRLLKA